MHLSTLEESVAIGEVLECFIIEVANMGGPAHEGRSIMSHPPVFAWGLGSILLRANSACIVGLTECRVNALCEGSGECASEEVLLLVYHN